MSVVRNVADLPLHGGHVPPWLAQRMRKLTRLIVRMAVEEYGTKGLLERLSDPVWFQALNNVIGMDWDSSGSTTVTSGIIKDALNSEEVGVKAAGGKGRRSLATPLELENIAELYGLDGKRYVRISRLVAKVDNVGIQAGYRLYHHMFLLDEGGNWAVIQQGMNEEKKMARRFHWFNVDKFTSDPHSAISGFREKFALNTVTKKSRDYQKALVDIAKEDPHRIENELAELGAIGSGYITLTHYTPRRGISETLNLVRRYRSLGRFELNKKAIEIARELDIGSYEELLLLKGLGPSTLRALSLVLELVYDVHPSWKDPVTHPPDPFKFAYAVGGKDRVPFPVEKRTYDELVSFLEEFASRNPHDRDLIRRITRITREWKFPKNEKVPT